ncbi:MAG: MgtC/SapB family protein [Peptostreptococcaceae bacterium]|nr:MgtC/SapB family protein [Peptostreptococcaceae bacterium]
MTILTQWMDFLKTDIFVHRLFLSFLLGTLIGLERQLRHKMSGIITNALVAVGATLFMLFGYESGANTAARMAAQIISGIGFLGGGVIIRDGFSVRGINTAATLWCSAAVGLLCSGGHLSYAILGTLVILTANTLLKPVARFLEESRFGSTDIPFVYKLRFQFPKEEENGVIHMLQQTVDVLDMSITGIESQPIPSSDSLELKVQISTFGQRDEKIAGLIRDVRASCTIHSYSYERRVASRHSVNL